MESILSHNLESILSHYPLYQFLQLVCLKTSEFV